MITLIIGLLTLLVEEISLILICDSVLKRKRKPLVFYPILGIHIISTFLLLRVCDLKFTSLTKTIITIFIAFLVLVLLYEFNIKKMIFIVLVWYICIYAIDYAVLIVSMLITSLTLTQVVSNAAMYILALCISKLLLFTSSYVLKKLHSGKLYNEKITFFEWARIILIPAFTILNMSLVVDTAIKQNHVSIWFIITITGLFVMNITLMFLLDKIASEQRIAAENKMLQMDAANRTEKAKTLMEAYKRERTMTHDFNNHILAIHTLLQNSEIESALSYTHHLSQTTCVQSVIDTGNPVINAVLNEEYTKAIKKHIAMHFKINNLSALPVTSEDIVIVLANLLDNALEACEKYGEGSEIIVKLLHTPTKTTLSVRNTSLPVLIENNCLISTKPDTLSHGFGLENIKRVLSKYNYKYVISFTGKWFCFTAERM